MKNLKEYLQNLCENDYQFNEEDTATFIETVMEYAESNDLTSLHEVDIYIDGLLTNLEIGGGQLG
jgi:hypothetical protein